MALVDGGDLVARAIKQEGVDTIFTLCGGHVQAIYDSCIDENIRIIDVRHEQVAGHAAEGWSRATRKCGVAVVTAGPGVTDATRPSPTPGTTSRPMLIIGGRSPLARFEMGALQDMDHTELLTPDHQVRQVRAPDRAHPGVHRHGLPRRADRARRARRSSRSRPTSSSARSKRTPSYFPEAYRPTGHGLPRPEASSSRPPTPCARPSGPSSWAARRSTGRRRTKSCAASSSC